MKTVLLFVIALSALASAYPRSTREDAKDDDSSDDTELFIVPLERSQPRRPSFGFGLTDDLVPPPFEQHPFFRTSPWGQAPQAGGEHVDDFMTQIQEMLKEMRRQLTDLVHHSHLGPDSGTGISEEDLPKNKSTSTTKVIDGHVVTVNETTYSSGDDNIGAVFRIKVVEVIPSKSPEGEETEEKPTETENHNTETEDNSTVAPHSEHEPTTSKSELEEDKHEETNEIPNLKVPYEWDAEVDRSLNEIDQPGVFSVEQFNPIKKENYYDLSDDTRVNDYVSDHAESQGLVMIEPDAELIDTNANSYYRYDRVPQRLQRFPY